jgi:hypothetical protein
VKRDGIDKSTNMANNANSSSDPTIAKSGKGFGSLVDMADRIKPTTSGKVFQKPLPGGTSITVGKQKGSASGVVSCPFSGILSAGKFQFTRSGTIGGLIPANMIQGNALLSLTLGSGWNYVYAQVQTLNGLIQSVTVAVQSTPIEPIGQTEGIPPTGFKIPLYIVLNAPENGRAIRMIGCGNLTISAVKVLSYAKNSLSCGEYPLVDVWTWQATLAA